MHYALIQFLNARPLWWGLRHRPLSGESFEFTSPAKCADLVSDGIADLGLVPAIELARTPGLVALPNLCIASRSEVRSVLLFSRVPFEEIRSVALDPSSRTSVSLARILLAERLGEARYREIKFDPLEPSRLTAFEGHDAVVVIGDPALQLSQSPKRLEFRYDLVSEWNALFDEPFVFAVWIGRKDRLAGGSGDELLARLEESFEYGWAHLEQIADEAAVELALPKEELLSYFREALHYRLGEPERRALARFHRLATKYGLAEAREVEWLERVPR
jgi:chorismate dehydratase